MTLRRRFHLALQGLGHLWASRRPWDRLELEAARSREATGRHQLLAAFLGTMAVPRPRPTLRRGELPTTLELEDRPELPTGAAVAYLEVALVLTLGLAALAWWG